MAKNKKLNKWLWKWHFIAGIVSLPFILLLAATGVIYLFKAQYEAPIYEPIKKVVVDGAPISYQQQWEIANANAVKKPNSMIVPKTKEESTEFVSGRFGGATSLYVNPYQGNVAGEILPQESFMFKVRKLHGELLMGSFGTKIVELVACWMVVLILTGLFIWWPERGWKVKGYFIPRTNLGKRTFFRDTHAITGFWMSILFLLILAGGLPWTDVWGAGFKKVQEITNTGFPNTWNRFFIEQQPEKATTLSLDQMVAKAKKLDLSGEVKISFPTGKNGVYSISNTNNKDLGSQKMIHFNPYTGKQVLKHNWEDVGFLMRGRMWVMAFHQGQFGQWNWILMLFTGVVLFLMSLSAIISYVLRKRKGDWGIPKVPASFKASNGVVILLALLCIALPLFGFSIILISIFTFAERLYLKSSQTRVND
ncbi:PepSY domain-containing protein [Galbibacter sp. BG1]|uniref:PepSY-associated TM helix domain-containing protein n=1 Tax=Galbibacter sp. BG1 TaxID=1170699 RepID=UPI0015BF61F6|nr:PepSY domain-containing protein [Galbibacter sp. BG1]QLE01437.1 PepSY domain-containing protein [Galbibacter sp. BG1]